MFPSDPIYDSGKRTEHQGGGAGKQNTGKIKDSKRKAVVDEAYRWIGVPYKYAGESRKGTDCSGFVMTVYKDVCGIKLPRNSAKQAEYCKTIKKNELQPGDLVFFATGKSKTKVSHVGIYVGDGNIIHASTSRGVTVNNISENYYTKTYICSGRVLSAGKKEEKRKDDKQQKEQKRKEQRKTKDSATDDDGVISSFMD
ncbi:MAG: C40 family peptidase [Muribaculaceae bacterium]